MGCLAGACDCFPGLAPLPRSSASKSFLRAVPARPAKNQEPKRNNSAARRLLLQKMAKIFVQR